MRSEITKNTGPISLTKQWFENGTVVEPDFVTFDLIDADGVSKRSGTATKAGSTTTTTFTVVITVVEAAEVEEYSLEWTRNDTGSKLVDDVGIVGSVLFTEAAARAFNIVGGQNPLDESASPAYSDREIREGRYRVTEILEKRTGVAQTKRFARVHLAGTGRDSIALAGADQTHGGPSFRRRPLTLIRGSVNGTALSSGELALIEVDSASHKFTRYDGSSWARPSGSQPPRNVTLGYEYGSPSISWEAERAGLMLLIKSIVPSDVSGRMTSFSNSDGTFRLSVPSLRFPTGIPEIDEFINAYDERPVFA